MSGDLEDGYQIKRRWVTKDGGQSTLWEFGLFFPKLEDAREFKRKLIKENRNWVMQVEIFHVVRIPDE